MRYIGRIIWIIAAFVCLIAGIVFAAGLVRYMIQGGSFNGITPAFVICLSAGFIMGFGQWLEETFC